MKYILPNQANVVTMYQVRKHQYSQKTPKSVWNKTKIVQSYHFQKTDLANRPKVVFLKILFISITKTHQYQFWLWVSERCRIAVERADIRTFQAAVFCQKKESWRVFTRFPRPPLTTYSDKSPTLPVSWEPLWLGECLVCGKERELMTNGDNYTNLSDPPVFRGCSTEGNMT